jgi:hypothetical protein
MCRRRRFSGPTGRAPFWPPPPATGTWRAPISLPYIKIRGYFFLKNKTNLIGFFTIFLKRNKYEIIVQTYIFS